MPKRPDPNEREQRRIMRDYEARQALHARQSTRRKRDNLLGIIAGAVVCGLAIFGVWAYSALGPGKAAIDASATPTPTPPGDATTTPTDSPLAVPDPSPAEGRTGPGTMTVGGVPLGVEFDGALAPQATAMFVQAAQTGWFDGKYCPRVTSYPNMQVLQCGTDAPDSTASESGYSFGPIENAPVDGEYPAGTIAMARVGGDGASMAHQFFIVTADSEIPSDAAGGYTIVGRVTSGLDALIAGVTSHGTGTAAEDGPPGEPVQITAFTIE